MRLYKSRNDANFPDRRIWGRMKEKAAVALGLTALACGGRSPLEIWGHMNGDSSGGATSAGGSVAFGGSSTGGTILSYGGSSTGGVSETGGSVATGGETTGGSSGASGEPGFGGEAGLAGSSGAGAGGLAGAGGEGGTGGVIIIPTPSVTVGNLIGDYVDRTLLDRQDHGYPSDGEYEMGGSDTSENANPFTDGNGGSIGPIETFMFKIDGSQFSPLEDENLTDVSSGNGYTEQQAIWIRGSNRFDSEPDDIVGHLDFVAYSMKFDGIGGTEEFGIPVCSDHVNGDYTACKSADGDYDNATELHKLEIMFLGEPWVITEMNAPADRTLDNENTLVSGGSIKIAKQSIGGILNQGELIQINDLSFQLDDIEDHNGTFRAIISVLDANSVVLQRESIVEGQTLEFNINGRTYPFHVYVVAPGYTTESTWIDMAILATEMELTDGYPLNVNEDDNPNYSVSLGWKNNNASSTVPDSLRTIVVWSDDVEDMSTSGESVLEAGDSIPIVENPSTWRLSYQGLDLTSEEMTGLTFEIGTVDREIPASDGPIVNGSQVACTIRAPYVEVSTNNPWPDAPFLLEIEDRWLEDNEFIVNIDPESNCGGRTLAPGSIVMRVDSTMDDYGVADYTDEVLFYIPTIRLSSTTGSKIWITTRETLENSAESTLSTILESTGQGNSVCASSQCADVYFTVGEGADGYPTYGFYNYWIFGVNRAGATFDFNSSNNQIQLTSDDESILYGHAALPPYYAAAGSELYQGVSGPVDPGLELVDEGYISEKGSVVTTIDSTRVEFNLAQRTAGAQWWLGYSN